MSTAGKKRQAKKEKKGRKMTTQEIIEALRSADDESHDSIAIARIASLLQEAIINASKTEAVLIEAELANRWTGIPVLRKEKDALLKFAHEAQNLVFAGEKPNWETTAAIWSKELGAYILDDFSSEDGSCWINNNTGSDECPPGSIALIGGPQHGVSVS